MKDTELETEGGEVKYTIHNFFTQALRHALSVGRETQAEVAKRVGVSQSVLSDYRTGRRGANSPEDIRRRIAIALGWDYGSFISLGQLIVEGEDPYAWALHNSFQGFSPKVRVWMSAKEGGDKQRVLVIPQPGHGDEGVRAFAREMRIEEWDPSLDFAYIKCFESQLPLGEDFDLHRAEWSTRLAFRKDWLERRGLLGRCAGFHVTDDAMHPIAVDGDICLVRVMTETEPVQEGKVYAFVDGTGRVVNRRLAIRGGEVLVYSDNPTVYPSYSIPLESLKVIGPVNWAGHEIN